MLFLIIPLFGGLTLLKLILQLLTLIRFNEYVVFFVLGSFWFKLLEESLKALLALLIFFSGKLLLLLLLSFSCFFTSSLSIY